MKESKFDNDIDKKKIEFSQMLGEMLAAMSRSGKVEKASDLYGFLGALIGKCSEITALTAGDEDDLKKFMDHNIDYYKHLTLEIYKNFRQEKE